MSIWPMTGGQVSLNLANDEQAAAQQNVVVGQLKRTSRLPVVFASEAELQSHEQRLDLVQKKGAAACGEINFSVAVLF